jgi:hypothetical protein
MQLQVALSTNMFHRLGLKTVQFIFYPPSQISPFPLSISNPSLYKHSVSSP